MKKTIKQNQSQRVQSQRIGQRLNKLLRYKNIMQEFDKYDCTLVPIMTIYRRFIYPKFYISRATMYRALSIDVDAEIAKVQRVKERVKNNEIQTFDLFNDEY